MNESPTIRTITPDDKSAVLDLAVATGLYPPDGLAEFEGMLMQYYQGHLDDHYWIVLEEGGIQGVAYYAPEMMTVGTWNLYFIGVQPEQQGKGYGAALLQHVEAALKAKGQRILIIETSGLDNYELTRKFYLKNGYDEEARIREFYREGEDKIVFWKKL